MATRKKTTTRKAAVRATPAPERAPEPKPTAPMPVPAPVAVAKPVPAEKPGKRVVAGERRRVKPTGPTCSSCSCFESRGGTTGMCRLQPPFNRVRSDDWCAQHPER